MNSTDRTDAPVAAQAYAVLAETISLRVARRLRPLRRIIVWQMRQSLQLRAWCAGVAKFPCVGFATVSFAVHRRFGARCGLFGRSAFACLAAAQRCFGVESRLRTELAALSASSFFLSVEPAEVSGDGNV